MINSFKEAQDCFYNKNYIDALDFFKENNDLYSAGLCCLLLKRFDEAETFWKMSKNYSPASNFGLCILKLINLEPASIPSFFQVRAFLEVYINLFLENNYLEWCENIISSSEILYQGNPETYKFIARALFANGYFDLAIKFCKKSLDLFYSDPEALLILAQCYFLLNDKEMAKFENDKILRMVKDYYPAILFNDILLSEQN